jgi:hypothetical protein
MPRESQVKPLSKKDCKSLERKTVYHDGEPYTSAKGMLIIFNALIEAGKTTLERCMDIMRQINAQSTKPVTTVPCLFCGKKFGTKQCGGCPKDDTMRYCSKECQLGAWPMHKAICASRQKHVVVKGKSHSDG